MVFLCAARAQDETEHTFARHFEDDDIVQGRATLMLAERRVAACRAVLSPHAASCVHCATCCKVGLRHRVATWYNMLSCTASAWATQRQHRRCDSLGGAATRYHSIRWLDRTLAQKEHTGGTLMRLGLKLGMIFVLLLWVRSGLCASARSRRARAHTQW
jgi:hypothetical protein